MQIDNSSTRFLRLIALLACTSPGIATAQESPPNFQGMWSDPPISPELSFCFVGCVLEAFGHFTALLDDPMQFDETYVELEALAVEYQDELVPEYLTTTGLDGYPSDFEQNDPSRQCQPWGLVLQMLAPHQMEITQYDDHIEILYAEWAARRTIYLDGRIPTDNGVSLLGHSMGRFEGETLVVETTNIRSDILFAGTETSSFTHSDQLRVTERYTKAQDDMRLEVVATFEDPIVLQEPLIILKPWAWAPDEQIFEYECVLESDGTELLAPGDEDVRSLEEQRRQRILEAQSSYGFLLEIIPGHYRYENGNRVAGVIVTDEGAVVLDGLSNPEMGQDVRAKVLAATGQPVRYLVNSTFHNNYTRGNAAYTDVVSIGHEFYREDLVTLMEENGASAEERASRLPKMTFTENMTLYLGGKEIQIIHIGPAHTRGDSIMYVPEDRIVYVSELIFYNQFPFYNSGYIGWIDAIDRILAMDVDIFVPGQGPMTYDDPRESRDKFLAIRQILVDARDGVQAQIAQGATEEEVLQNVTLEQYAYVGDAFEAQSQVMLSRMYRELMGTLE